MAGITHSTLFFVGVTWLKLLPYTANMLLLHICFALTFASCIFSLYRASFGDPGFIRKCSSIESKNLTVLELANSGSLDARNFCMTCWVFFI